MVNVLICQDIRIFDIANLHEFLPAEEAGFIFLFSFLFLAASSAARRRGEFYDSPLRRVFGIWNLKFLLGFRVFNLEFKNIQFCAKLEIEAKNLLFMWLFFFRFFEDCPGSLNVPDVFKLGLFYVIKNY